MVLNKDYIKKLLKHREPFLFVDEVLNIGDNRIEAMLKITKDFVFFKGHFPDEPIMPGVLLVEALAQSAGILIIHNLVKKLDCKIENIKYDSYLVKFNSFKFKDKIVPDAILIFKAEIKKTEMENIFEVIGQILVNNKIKAFGNILLYFKYELV